jgi:hypothetical protein
MVTEKEVTAIGTGLADPSAKLNPDLSRAQAVVNLTNVMQLIALILIDIRDGNKAGRK